MLQLEQLLDADPRATICTGTGCATEKFWAWFMIFSDGHTIDQRPQKI